MTRHVACRDLICIPAAGLASKWRGDFSGGWKGRFFGGRRLKYLIAGCSERRTSNSARAKDTARIACRLAANADPDSAGSRRRRTTPGGAPDIGEMRRSRRSTERDSTTRLTGINSDGYPDRMLLFATTRALARILQFSTERRPAACGLADPRSNYWGV